MYSIALFSINIFFRTGDWWKNYDYPTPASFTHCLSSNMYLNIVGMKGPIEMYKGWRITLNFKRRGVISGCTDEKGLECREEKKQEGVYPFQMMDWFHCRYNLSFACEGTAVHPNTHYG